VDELKVLTNAFIVHMGMNLENVDDFDYPRNRFMVQRNIKLIENIPQMFLVLIETFDQKQTITAIQSFNVLFGLLMSIVTFAEHAGTLLAAKYQYVHFKDLSNSSDEGLSDDEWEFKKELNEVFQNHLKDYIDPEEYFKMSRENAFYKLFNKMFGTALSPEECDRILFPRGEQFPLSKRIENSLEEVLLTQVSIMALFTGFFLWKLDSYDSVSALVQTGIIQSHAKLPQLIQSYAQNQCLIISSLTLAPVFSYAALKIHNRKPASDSLT